MGTVALFSTDRSLTGQDGVSLSPEDEDGADPPHELARRLFDADPLIDHVHVLSNTVAARRRESWDDEAVGRAGDVIANLFVHYDHRPGSFGCRRVRAAPSEELQRNLEPHQGTQRGPVGDAGHPRRADRPVSPRPVHDAWRWVTGSRGPTRHTTI